MISYGVHSARAEGVEKFAEWLDAVTGVQKVLVGNLRTRKVGPGKSEPKFVRHKHYVLVHYYQAGTIQVIRVYPQRVVPVADLLQRLEREWARRQQRGGVGMSPKDPIVLSGHILRQQAKSSSPATAFSTLAPGTAVLEPEPEESPMRESPISAQPTGAPIELPLKQAEAYQHLLSQDSTGALEFKLERAFALLEKHLGRGKANSVFQMLKHKGLIEPLEAEAAKPGVPRMFLIRRRPCQIVEAPVRAAKPKMPGQPATDAREDDESLEAHYRFFTKHQSVLEEADRRRKTLSRKGFEVINLKDRLVIVPKR